MNGGRIDKDVAAKLCEKIGMTEQFWLNLQEAHDNHAQHVKRNVVMTIKRVGNDYVAENCHWELDSPVVEVMKKEK